MVYEYIAEISIHALVKRATALEGAWICEVGISIHALVKRATTTCRTYKRSNQHFNPRPREEGDHAATDKALDAMISIHALVKRATRLMRYCCSELKISIHALVKRAT